MQKKENSTLLVGTHKEKQPGYQKGISISEETWKKIEAEGGKRAEPTVINNSNSMIQIKPEHEVALSPGAVKGCEAVDVLPGQVVYGMVDAIAISTYNDASFKLRDGNRATVTNSGKKINSYGTVQGFGGFIYLGGWGYKFPQFVKNSSVAKQAKNSLAKEQQQIQRALLSQKPFTP